ncbi:FAM172 family protein homolog CG10038 isoform X2 [Rhodnius prolixus]
MSSKEGPFPKTLEGFGYKFNEEGKLRKIDTATGNVTDIPFQFNVSSDPSYNQKRYEAVGEVVTEVVYDLLDKEGLKRLPVPQESANGSFIFCTENAQESDKIIILIHGTGVVKAGQWARSLIVNDCLDSGTQLPYIRKAQELGYGVFVLNTNDNFRLIDGKKSPIKGSSNAQEHASTVWSHYITQSRAQKIAIIAHSFGGVVTMSLASNFEEDFLKRVFAIGLTDSVHGKIPRAVSSVLADHLAKIGRNWVSSSDVLDSPLPEQTGEIQCVSAGISKHELTSWSCMDSLFSFIEERLENRLVSTRDEL